MKLENKVAVVTGGSRGIGYATVEKFIKEGAKVCLTASSEASAEKAVAKLKEAYPNADIMGIAPTLSSLESVQAEFAKVVEKYGRIDILINNAGITKDGLIMRMKEEDFDRVIDVNLKGTFNCIRHVSRYMLKQRSGRIINMSSVVGIAGNAGQVNYSASKAGVIGITKSAAKELASRGITVNAVAPGYIDTDMTKVLSDEQKKSVLDMIPLSRMGSVDDISNAVAFLASDEAAYITGQVISVDGGMNI